MPRLSSFGRWRPTAIGHHRFEWLYVTGFVEPTTGRTVWNVSNTIGKEFFELVLADFAKSAGAGKQKRIVLQLDNAGWHGPENLEDLDTAVGERCVALMAQTEMIRAGHISVC